MPKLHPHIGVPVRSHRVLPALATIAILLVAEGLNVPAFQGNAPSKPEMASSVSSHIAPAAFVLSSSDTALYRNAFTLQQAGREKEADGQVAQVDDPLLKGVLLAERYLAPGYQANFSELALWLTRYGDHAQASELYRMARTRVPDDAGFLTEPPAKAALKGFSNGHDRSALAEEKHWVSGLVAFRRGDMHNASAHFKALLAADEGYLSSDDYAAVAFWAYRTALATGEKEKAMHYLNIASAQQPSFYSILARQIAGESTAALTRDETGDISTFLQKPAVRRAMALKIIGQDALAEKELRALFPASGPEDRKHLTQLAGMLHLPAAQIRMAVSGNYDAKVEGAQYPLPHWKPTSGYRVEPALLFAIMRQESGFNPNAKSASGALGVMQLMPATAYAMAREVRMAASHEPAASMSLGQQYLRHLMDLSSINDNLVFIIGAYNAGPGTMLSWQKSLHAIDDPLLFVESIPSASARDYIVHVMGNYWVYSDMLGGDENKSVEALAQNHWPKYERAGRQMVAMVTHLSAESAEQ